MHWPKEKMGDFTFTVKNKKQSSSKRKSRRIAYCKSKLRKISKLRIK